MANLEVDVIELGSSDEETEPAPKKKKPMQNVMVQIPKKLPDITIKPANKPKVNPVSIVKADIGKTTTVKHTKFLTVNGKVSNPYAIKNIPNGKINMQKQTVQAHSAIANNPALTVVPPLKRIYKLPVGKMPVKVVKGIALKPTLVKQVQPSVLPPGITVKRTSQLQSTSKSNIKPNPANKQIRRQYSNTAKKKSSSQMVYVDLDDDDATPSLGGPQWYLRPEEHKNIVITDLKEKQADSEKKISNLESGSSKDETSAVEIRDADLERLNNKEPETSKFIEIIIEDSPVKPQSKRTCETAITIDDSPVKVAKDKALPATGSNEEVTAGQEKHSKKKLDYPSTDTPSDKMEIEIELTPVKDAGSHNDVTTSSEDEIVRIVEAPMKSKPTKANDIKSASACKSQTNTENNEFHPVYQTFIDLCFKLENSEDMRRIVEKKVKAYYRQVPKEYTESEMFIDFVSGKIHSMRVLPDKMYLYIKDVVDELNSQRKIARMQHSKVVTINEEQEKCLYGEGSEFDSKRQRQIRKLEKTLKKLHRAIQKLEEQEVDFDDEEDSVYLLTERYKERMIRVHAKFCQLTNTKMPSEPRVHIDARPGQPKGPAKRLEKWINKKVTIGTTLPFPDFHDVLRCVRDANQEDKLCWNEADIMEEARDLFTRCGKKLQRRRQENEWRLAASRIQSQSDPAEEDNILKKALEDNRRVSSRKESEVLNKYADRQNQLNLEPVEIGDKEADESPVETDDDDPTDEKTSLETKEKRKESLKRLIHKKSKKPMDIKEQADSGNENTIKQDKSQVVHTKKAQDKNKEPSSDESQIETNKQNDMKNDPLSGNRNTEKDPSAEKSDSEKIHSLSDDSSNIDSDIDELHLLQKLHSDIVESSNLESSDSESPIAISDGISSCDNRNQASDVISIEDSSYSESEKNNEQEYEIVSCSQKNILTSSVDEQMKIKCSDTVFIKEIIKSNTDEYNESVENILLASSDDERNKNSEDINETGLKQSKVENAICMSEENASITDANSVESVESQTITENTNLKNNNAENGEVTNISKTDVDYNIISDYVTNTNLLETDEDGTNTGLVVNTEVAVTSVISAEVVQNTNKNSLEKVNEETIIEENNVKLTKHKVTSEVKSDKLTESDKDKIINPNEEGKPNPEFLVTTNSETNISTTEGISSREDKESEKTDVIDTIDKESNEQASNDC